MTHARNLALATTLAAAALAAQPAVAQETFSKGKGPRDDGPKVVIISLDGARPAVIADLLKRGVLPKNGALGRLSREGVVARFNETANPSLTAVSHIAIATGSTAVHNDVPSNTFHPVGGVASATLSGFAAPIGGYDLEPLGPDTTPTAEPLWVKLRKKGKTVVAATWPGADGATISVNNTPVQNPTPTRVVDYTVPFGAFGGLSAAGFSLDGAAFATNTAIGQALADAGHPSFSPVKATPDAIETFKCSSAPTATCSSFAALDVTYAIRVAALDSTDDGKTNYDTLVFFDAAKGVASGEPKLPSTGPAYAKVGGASARFFLEGSGVKAGVAFFAAAVAPDLATVRFIRYGASYIPRNAPVIDAVDDVNENVGFWAPQPDFRLPERLTPGLDAFSDLELEAAYQDQVETFLAYQSAVATRAIKANKNADLVMVYFEEPDGSQHQFLLTDPRQATDPRDPSTIGDKQDAAKVKRYARYVETAYNRADKGVAAIIEAAGPKSNVIVVSDHGFAPFHTAVNLTNLLKAAGIDTSKLTIRTSGPAAHIYVPLQGREADGSVTPAEYKQLVEKIGAALRVARDGNDRFNYSLKNKRLFTTVIERPLDCKEGVGLCVNKKVGQDSGDVFAQMDLGYNFDGAQTPLVARMGDGAADPATTIFSTPNFYGAHGHDASIPEMSATFIAAGPDFRKGTLKSMRNIDVAPTIEKILGVRPADTVDGKALTDILK